MIGFDGHLSLTGEKSQLFLFHRWPFQSKNKRNKSTDRESQSQDYANGRYRLSECRSHGKSAQKQTSDHRPNRNENMFVLCHVVSAFVLVDFIFLFAQLPGNLSNYLMLIKSSVSSLASSLVQCPYISI